MMVIAGEHRYVVRDDSILSGEPIIKGTRTPVRAIVELCRLGVTPEEIPAHPPHLTIAQVFDALSYYSDHQTEIQAYIDRNQVPEALTHPVARTDNSPPSVYLDEDVSVIVGNRHKIAKCSGVPPARRGEPAAASSAPDGVAQ